MYSKYKVEIFLLKIMPLLRNHRGGPGHCSSRQKIWWGLTTMWDQALRAQILLCLKERVLLSVQASNVQEGRAPQPAGQGGNGGTLKPAQSALTLTPWGCPGWKRREVYGNQLHPPLYLRKSGEHPKRTPETQEWGRKHSCCGTSISFEEEVGSMREPNAVKWWADGMDRGR